MKVCLDATDPMCLLDPRKDVFPVSGGSIFGRMRHRMDYLVATIDQGKGSVIVPTPTLAKLLTRGEQKTSL